MNAPENDPYPHEPDMLVVDAKHAGLVLRTLNGAAGQPKEDPDLGLTRVPLTQTSQILDSLREPADAARRNCPGLPPVDRGWPALDQILADLRALFAYDYAGWAPSMGKNRIMNGVQFVTYPNAEVPAPQSFDAPEEADVRDIADRIERARAADRYGGAGVRVGLLDTSLYPHELLDGTYIAANGAMLRKSADPWYSVQGHSMFVASLILAEAPSAQLDVRALVPMESDDRPAQSTTVWDAARHMVRYANSGVQVLNCSWACYTRDGKPPLVLERAIALLASRILIVAAAGNHGQRVPDCEKATVAVPPPNAPAYPAALPDVIAVGALNGGNSPASFNPKGAQEDLAPWLDILAPGTGVGAFFGDTAPQQVRVRKPPGPEQDLCEYLAAEPEYECKPFSGAASWTGTSFAAAAVTGAVAVAARAQPHMSAREAVHAVLTQDGRFKPPPQFPSL